VDLEVTLVDQHQEVEVLEAEALVVAVVDLETAVDL
jgi:hypothetical protein